jgi:acetyl-CoA carboxylase carboxyltransferase component
VKLLDTNDRIEELREKISKAKLGGGEERIARQHKKSKLTARERLDILLDPGSFNEVDMFVTHRYTEPEMSKGLGDGVVVGHGTIEGRLVFVYAQDFTFMGGSLGEMHAMKICKVMDLAMEMGAPIIGLNDSGGARIQEGVGALAGYGEIFRRNVMASGVVPQITAIMGPCAGGAVYSPALTDFIIMVRGSSHMFITGPSVIESVTGEEVTMDELGSAEVHSQVSGVASIVAESDEDCLMIIRRLLSYLPSNNLEDPPAFENLRTQEHDSEELLKIVPADQRKVYDVTEVINRVVDTESFIEVHEEFAQNVITGLARAEGIVVGVVANQPGSYAGCLTVDASDKIARFVRFCDAFSIPLITFVDVPGYMPGIDQEYGGIIRHGAKVIYAYAEATVPKITIVLRKGYGGGYIAMCSKHIGADLVVAWPTAEIAVMGPEGAIGIVYRKELGEAEDSEAEKERLVEEYREKFANPYIAASMGYIDKVIEPQKTRQILVDFLKKFSTKRDLNARPAAKHGNIPL